MQQADIQIPDLNDVSTLVRTISQQEIMCGHASRSFECKQDGSVVTKVDLAMQTRLEAELGKRWPQFDMLGEEMDAADQQAVVDSGKPYWCIDPLDGTSNFTAGIPVFAVSVALVIGQRQQLGLIYDPVRDEMFTAIDGQGAWLNDKPLRYQGEARRKNQPVIAEIDLKRLPVDIRTRLVSGNLFSSQRNVGSSAIDWAWLAAGRFDVYLHGGQKLWDYAAGSLIFREAGGTCVSFDNAYVFQGKLEKRSVLAAFDQALFRKWFEWLELPFTD